jgi:hypothetical protein
MKRIAVMLLAAALLTGVASADIQVYTGTVYDAFITDPVAVGDGSENLIGFTLYFVNKDVVSKAFDTFDDVSNPLFTGITAGALGKGLHQHDSTLLGSFSPTLSNPNYATAIDSHFLVLDGNLLNVQAPNEDRLVAPSLEASDAGVPFDGFGDTSFGTHMGGAFADSTAAGVSPRNLAYLVVQDPGLPLTGVAYLDALSVVDNFYLGSGPGGGEVLQFGIGVLPEPATMSLLAIGGIAALIRRRK